MEEEKRIGQQSGTEAEASVWIDRSNAALQERCNLSMERLMRLESLQDRAGALGCSETTALALGPFDAYFSAVSAEARRAAAGVTEGARSEAQETFWLNHACVEEALGPPYGRLLCAWYAELQSLCPLFAAGRLSEAAALLETSLQLYGVFEMAVETCGQAAQGGLERPALPEEQALRDVIYSYYYDYLEEWTAADVTELGRGSSARTNMLLREGEAEVPAAGRSAEGPVAPEGAEAAEQTAAWFSVQQERLLDVLAEQAAAAYLRQLKALDAEAAGGYSASPHSIASPAGAAQPLASFAARECLLAPLSAPPGFACLLQKLLSHLAAAGIETFRPVGPMQLVTRFDWPFRPGVWEKGVALLWAEQRNDMALFQGDRLKARRVEALGHALKQESAALGRLTASLWIQTEEREPQALDDSTFTVHQRRVNATQWKKSAALFERYLPRPAGWAVTMLWPRPEKTEAAEAYAARFCRAIGQKVQTCALFER